MLMFGVLAGCFAEPADLLNGVALQYSTDGGETFSTRPPTIQPGAQEEIVVKAEFQVYHTWDIASVNLSHSLDPRVIFPFTLNGQPITKPIEGMVYKAVPGIDRGMLVEGTNVLLGTIRVVNEKAQAKRFSMKLSLTVLTVDDLAFQTGPVLGAYDEGYFTVICRTNIPAEVTLRVAAAESSQVTWETVSTSPRKLLHRFKAPHRLNEPFRYRMEASRDGVVRKTPWYDANIWTPASGRGLKFVAMGDSRTLVQPWRQVAGAVSKAEPDLVIFVGDMVTSGELDWEWDEQFIGPSRDLFRKSPMYPVIGNHENGAPVYNELFYSPTTDGRGLNWYQTKDDVLLIGIVGYESFAVGTDNYNWLENVLAQSNAKFIFLFSHYPGWTSNQSGDLNEQGQPYDAIIHQAQTVIMPLLAKYNATAMIAGHYHCYERTEPPCGVTQVVTAGAGAPLKQRAENAEENNPYSAVFVTKYHYCLLETSGDTCTMTAITPTGQIIDTRTWQARESP